MRKPIVRMQEHRGCVHSVRDAVQLVANEPIFALCFENTDLQSLSLGAALTGAPLNQGPRSLRALTARHLLGCFSAFARPPNCALP